MVAGEGFFKDIVNEPGIHSLGTQFLCDSMRPVTPGLGARTRPIPGEALIAGIACCAKLRQNLGCQSGRIPLVF
jgi:hypothetical protein